MGEVTFWQKSKESKVDMLVNITFQDPKPTRQYNLNVHEFGITFNHLDSAIRCLSVGDHYNPTNVTHGMPSDAAHHLGDLGDVKAMEDGNIFFDIKDIDIKLCGPKSVIGRSVVLSSKPEVMDLSENESNSKKKIWTLSSHVVTLFSLKFEQQIPHWSMSQLIAFFMQICI